MEKNEGIASASKASGVDVDDLSPYDLDAGIMWILEPLRTSRTDKWTGTLVQPDVRSKKAATISAFGHFSLLFSQYSMVFVDLQSASTVCHLDYLVTDYYYRLCCYEGPALPGRAL